MAKQDNGITAESLMSFAEDDLQNVEPKQDAGGSTPNIGSSQKTSHVKKDHPPPIKPMEICTQQMNGSAELNRSPSTDKSGSPNKRKRQSSGNSSVVILEPSFSPKIDISGLSVKCTACDKQINQFFAGSFKKHPKLNVLVCRQCYLFLTDNEPGNWTFDCEGYDEQCQWCGDGGEIWLCDNCKHSFCTKCIRRILDRKSLDRVGSGHWRCFFCDPSRIQHLQDVCDAVLYHHQKKKLKKFKSTPSNSQTSSNSNKKSNSESATKKSAAKKSKVAAETREKEKKVSSPAEKASDAEGKKKIPSKARLVSAAEIANQGHGDFLQLLKRLENSNRNFGTFIKTVKQSVAASVGGGTVGAAAGATADETVTKLESLASDLCSAIEAHAKIELETMRELQRGVMIKIPKPKTTPAGSLPANAPSTSTANHQPCSPATSDLSAATPGFDNDGVSFAIQTIING